MPKQENNKISKVLILGAGGHARVCCDIFESNNFKIGGIYDDDKHLLDKYSGHWKITGDFRKLLIDLEFERKSDYFVAIGDNNARETMTLKIIKATGKYPLNCISGSSIISKNCILDTGILIAPGSVINIGAKVKMGVIVNTGATIDHDCILEDFSSVQPGVHLAGGVKIGKRSQVGIGACIKQYIEVGSDVFVGGGAMVIKNVLENTTVLGVPAKQVTP